jgi:Rrf2 family iron-sulfur cluster assembly transcriptional regulator
MELTIKTQYGIKTFLDIAYHHEAGPVQRKHIMLRQGIPTDYLDLVLTRMKEHGLIHSFRGREGGYHLAMTPEEVSVWDIVEAVEDLKHRENHHPSPENSQSAKYVTEPALELLEATIRRNLKRLSVEMLLEEGQGRLIEKGLDPIQLSENRPQPTRTPPAHSHQPQPSRAPETRIMPARV